MANFKQNSHQWKPGRPRSGAAPSEIIEATKPRLGHASGVNNLSRQTITAYSRPAATGCFQISWGFNALNPGIMTTKCARVEPRPALLSSNPVAFQFPARLNLAAGVGLFRVVDAAVQPGRCGPSFASSGAPIPPTIVTPAFKSRTTICRRRLRDTPEVYNSCGHPAWLSEIAP